MQMQTQAYFENKKTMKQYILSLIGIIFCGQLIAQVDATVIYNNTVNSTVTVETDIGLGSGFFIDKNIIVTNYHVIEGATIAYCYTNNDATKYEIDGYVAVDTSVDLILLKVTSLNKTPLKFATSAATPGQKVYVIGSPKGLSATISDGIISGLRDFGGYKLIQITAPISPGSSGGPVLNSNGELIGVAVCQLKEGQNLNFAIPKTNVELLLNFKKDYATSIKSLYVPPPPIQDNYSTFIDSRDGKTYNTVKIGTQTWMAENLNYKTSDSWCYDNNSSNCNTYGRLYTWEAALNACPSGWHLPTDAEWITLTNYLGGEDVAGGKLKSTTGWDSPNTGATNSSGFLALPSGACGGNDGSFSSVGHHGYWWSSTEDYTDYAWFRYMDYDYSYVLRDYSSKSSGWSVRCLKDN